MRFEFDPAKNEANQQKHHVSFEEAAEIWNDPNLLVVPAKRRGERRLLAIGATFSAIYSVIHTKRGDVIRLISARRPTQKERRAYEQHKDY